MTTEDLQSIQARIQNLEKRNLNLKISLAVVVAVLVVVGIALALTSASGDYKVDQELRALKEQLAAREQSGSLVVKELTVESEDGKSRATLKVDDGERPSVKLVGDDDRVLWQAPIRPGGHNRMAPIEDKLEEAVEKLEEERAAYKERLKKKLDAAKKRLKDGNATPRGKSDKKMELFKKEFDEAALRPDDKALEPVEEELVIDREEYDRCRVEDALADLGNAMTQARIIPNFTGIGADRKVDGFRIYRIEPGSVFECLGLQNGDVIKSINGEKIEEVETGLTLFQSLNDKTSYTLEIERHHDEKVIRLNAD